MLERKNLQGIVQENKVVDTGGRKQLSSPAGETTRGLEISKWRAECRLSLLHNPKFLKNAKLTECVVIATLRA